MQRALVGFICLTALQELLLAHRKHIFVDLLLAGVTRGEAGREEDARDGGGGGGGDKKNKEEK